MTFDFRHNTSGMINSQTPSAGEVDVTATFETRNGTVYSHTASTAEITDITFADNIYTASYHYGLAADAMMRAEAVAKTEKQKGRKTMEQNPQLDQTVQELKF
jgi:hypothetical protein